jgi:adenylate cyclase
LGYEYMGEQAVKNIEKPVRVYRVLMEPEQGGKVIGEKGPKRTQWRWVAAAVIIAVAGALSLWNFYLRPPSIEPASKDKMAYPLPDKPSIAVLVPGSQVQKLEAKFVEVVNSLTQGGMESKKLFKRAEK